MRISTGLTSFINRVVIDAGNEALVTASEKILPSHLIRQR